MAACDDFTVDDTTNLTVVQNGAGHFVDYGNIAASSSINWTVKTEGFPVGTTGSPVTTTANGNETILVDVDAGETFTINVASGATIPSVKNDGLGDVNIVAGQVSLEITGTDIVGGKIIIYDEDDADPQNMGTELDRFDPAAASQFFTYSSALAGDTIKIHALKTGFKAFIREITRPANDTEFEIILTPETN